MTSFDSVIVVDWSASATPSPAKFSADAIWIGVRNALGQSTRYHRTRAQAEAALVQVLHHELKAGRRVLAGFDFPFGYPDGFAAALTGTTAPHAVWEWLADAVSDGPNNQNNRFLVAQDINRRFAAAGPFWGRPAALNLPDLPATKMVDYPGLGFAERRLVETRVPRAQPVWKLFTTGAVGSQSLMGLPMISRLVARFGASVWPFEPLEAPLVLAEVYPSLMDPAVRTAVQQGEIKDAAQVRLLAQALWQMGRDGSLPAVLRDVPDAACAEEGWILGAGHQATMLTVIGTTP